MPDTSPEAAAPDDGIERLLGDGGAEGRGALDVPEWVSELRRLYVEPKTRASLRQQGAIAPQKRKLGLPGGRGSRRGTASTESPAPDSHDGQTADAMVVAPPPLNPEAPLPAPLEPVQATPLAEESGRRYTPPDAIEESGERYTPPDAIEEEKVASWLTSYLVATGHAADDDTEAATTPAAGVPGHHTPSDPTTGGADPVAVTYPARPVGTAPPVGSARLVGQAQPVGQAAPSDDVQAAEGPPAARGHSADPEPAVVEELPREAEHVESHPRSLAELAGLSEPEPALPPRVDPHPEPQRAEGDRGAALVPTGGAVAMRGAAATDGAAATGIAAMTGGATVATTAAVVTRAESDDPPPVSPDAQAAAAPEVEPAREAVLDEVPAASPATVDPGSAGDVAPEAVSTPPQPAGEPLDEPLDNAPVEPLDEAPVEPLDEAPVENAAVPGRGSTVPPVTLSWREAESFEIGVPGVADSEGAIVVEAPSQLVAESRRRRRDFDAVEESRPEPGPEPEPAEPAATPAVPETSRTRAAARAASGSPSGKRRQALLVGLVLVVLAIVAWYFLLRDDGDASAAHSGESSTVAAVPLTGSLHPPGIPAA